MDPQTLAAYDSNAAAFAEDWHVQPAPVDLQEVVERFFVRGGNSDGLSVDSTIAYCFAEYIATAEPRSMNITPNQNVVFNNEG